jgi:hypothetical protein
VAGWLFYVWRAAGSSEEEKKMSSKDLHLAALASGTVAYPRAQNA